MLMTMRANVEGCRALALVAAAAYDAAHHHPDAEVRKQNQAFYEFMVPLVKGYSTEMSLEVDVAWACRCTAAWASSRKPAWRSTTATPRS